MGIWPRQNRAHEGPVLMLISGNVSLPVRRNFTWNLFTLLSNNAPPHPPFSSRDVLDPNQCDAVMKKKM